MRDRVSLNRRLILRRLSLILAVLFVIVALTVDLATVPAPWWDEGWTMSVARNWVELGHYGQLQDGKLLPRKGLEAGVPVSASVALSFWLFGTGVFQARSMMVIYSLATFAVLYYLGFRLFGRKIALATLFMVMMMAPHADTHTLLMSRQVLGEMPAMLFILGGYVCLLRALEDRPWLIIGSIGSWSLALVTKAQFEPFWGISLAVPLTVAVIGRKWKVAGLLGLGLSGSEMLSWMWLILFEWLQIASPRPLTGLTQAVAVVLTSHVRLMVFHEILEFGLPTLFGLTWAVWTYRYKRVRVDVPIELIKSALLMLAGSWFAWFALLSIGWPRYFFPPMFLSSCFVAAMLCDWTDGFNAVSTFQRCKRALRNLQCLRALLATLLISVSILQSGIILYGAFVVNRDDSLMRAVEYLNTQTPLSARIETYETELFPFLKRRYHYPPDQVHVELIRRNSLGETPTIDYDPLEADPDYLVLGRINRFWGFYDRLVRPADFQLLQTIGRYEIYQRAQFKER